MLRRHRNAKQLRSIKMPGLGSVILYCGLHISCHTSNLARRYCNVVAVLTLHNNNPRCLHDKPHLFSHRRKSRFGRPGRVQHDDSGAECLGGRCRTRTPAGRPPTLGQEVGAVANNKVEVVFPAGGATLTPDANQKLDLAARLFRDANPVLMFTTGYADRSGDEFGNLLLSARRAEAVKRGLVARGIPADRLLIQALGESELADSSKPLSAENRRVVITWRLL